MNRGLLWKTWRETRIAALLFGLGLLLVEALLTYVLPRIQAGLSDIFLQLPLVKTLLTALLGTDIGSNLTAPMLQAILWVHPVVLTIVWAFAIMQGTRMPAGEIDRGTIDVLLGWPVSRREIYHAETAIAAAAGVFLLAMAYAGHLVSVSAMPANLRPAPADVLRILANKYCVYLAVCGIAFLVSALSDRRGRAAAVVISFVLASFLLNFIAQFWEPAERIAFLSLMRYYQPVTVLLEASLPIADMGVLIAIGAGAWAFGGEVVARRSICTV